VKQRKIEEEIQIKNRRKEERMKSNIKHREKQGNEK
jgi:hypothetical protein